MIGKEGEGIKSELALDGPELLSGSVESLSWMNYTFPNTNNGGDLKSKVFLPEEVGSDLPVTDLV